MALLEEWHKIATMTKQIRESYSVFGSIISSWRRAYMRSSLQIRMERIGGTVRRAAEKYELSIMEMTGFLDGINDSLVTPNPIEEMDEDTKVSLAFDKEKLYKNMVDAKADWLYNLPAWDEIFDAETKHALYLEQKKSGTVVVGKKIGRNDPCPCGSGKKYKKCCGKNA